MVDISKIDSNFKVETKINKQDMRFFSVDEAPFQIYGVLKENGKYRRMPEAVAKSVSPGVYALHANTAGGRVRFVTDSPYIAIHTTLDTLLKMSHFSLTGSLGFDLYANNRYVETYIPPFDIANGYEGIIELGERKAREITINLPLYCDVKELHIGLKEGCLLQAPQPYKNEKPIVYYGSSITQGGCASRPGMCYQAMLSREFNYDYINLGFAGNAKAEDEMIDYIKNLDMSLFVYDYDHNAPTVEYLANTHEKMFQAVREKHPLIPAIIMSRPKHFLTEEEEKRRAIIETTYQNAISKGDKNVYFIDGKALTELCQDSGTVDNTHPTDFGFVSIAHAVSKVLKTLNL